MPSTTRVEFRVAFDLPPDCSRSYAKECLESHLSIMGGDLRPPGSIGDEDPGDPMFGLDRSSISVCHARRKK